MLHDCLKDFCNQYFKIVNIGKNSSEELEFLYTPGSNVNSISILENNITVLFKAKHFGAREMGPWLTAIVALAEDWGSVPSPHMVTDSALEP